MRIAQIALLAERLPPTPSYLAEELERLGHAVTPFGNHQLEEVRGRAHEFDVLHFHAEHAPVPRFRPLAHKTLTTLYGGPGMLDGESADMPLVSISDSQRAPLAPARWAGTVYPGLAREVCPFNPAPRGEYVAFLARASPESLERAMDVAHRAGVRVRAPARIDDAGKPAFLGNATALMFPAGADQPFDLAMIEALSCGTPVVAWRDGAAAEVIEDGVTGFLVQSIDAAVEALSSVARLDRMRVRRRFEERFSATRMAQDYLALYRALARRRALAA